MPRATKPAIPSGRRSQASRASASVANSAKQHAPEPLIRATPSIPQPLKVAGHFRVEPAGNRLEVIVTVAWSPSVRRDGLGVAAQVIGLEYFRRRHGHRGNGDEIPSRRQGHVAEVLAHTFGETTVAVYEHRHIGAQAQAELLKLGARKTSTPQAIERHQRRGGIRTAATQAAAERQSLAQVDGDARSHAGPKAQQIRCPHGQIGRWRDAGQWRCENDPAIVARRKTQFVAVVQEPEDRLQQVIAIGTTTDHVKKQVDFGRRRPDAVPTVHRARLHSSIFRRTSMSSRRISSKVGKASRALLW